jgi:hypothetical protein
MTEQQREAVRAKAREKDRKRRAKIAELIALADALAPYLNKSEDYP